MNIKEIVEGMTAPQVAQVIKDNFNEVDKDKANLNKSISDLASVVEANKADLTKKIDNNKDETDAKLSELVGKEIDVALTFGKTITDKGVLVEPDVDGYFISDSITLSSGDVLSITTGGWGIAYLSKVNSDNTYTPISVRTYIIGDEDRATVNVLVNESGNYVICGRWDLSASIKPKNLQVYDILLHGELGGFSLDSGLPINDVSEKELLLRSSLSNRLMSVNVSKGEYIISVEMMDLEELYIEQFDSEFRYIGYSQSLSLMENCRYIRIAVTNSESIPSTRPIKCKILSADKPRLICLGQETIGNNGYGTFVYEVSSQKKVGESVDTEYHGNKDRLINVGNIILPPNYTREGEPVPLIIHCHGTLGINPKNGVINYNLPYLQFLANNGYAVADCGTVTTSELTTSTSDYDCQFPNQIGMSCYSELVKFLMNKYNLKQDGVYVFGYSAGGMPTIYLSQLQPFKIKCAASLAGSVDVITNNRVLWGEEQEIKYWYDTMGMNKEVGTSCLSGGNFGGPIRDEERDELIEHIDNIIGYNPMWMNTVGFDFVNYIKEIAKINILNYEDSESLQAIIDKATAYIPVPLKVWHAIDDVNVPIDTTRFYVQMLKRGGSLVILRELPQNCGKHYAMGYTLYDGSSGEVPMFHYKPKYSEEVEIPVVYAELVDWFNNW